MQEQQDIFTDPTDKTILAAFSWWEKRRLLYNIIVGITGLLVLVLFSFFTLADLIGVVIYGITANVFYCTGFLSEVIDKHYFKSTLDLGKRREGIFWCGVILSVLITLGLGLMYGFIQQL
ncbi:MAG TPA: hypothetical protein VF476_03020 [Chitinophagaceae bacterium]